MDVGAHIDASRTMERIYNDPDGYDELVGSYGTWPTALADHQWDAITLQPHQTSTLTNDVTQFGKFITAAKANPAYTGTTFYVLQTWPYQFDWPYSDYWAGASPDLDSTPTEKRGEYFDHLVHRLRVAYPAEDIRMIPVGEVFNELHLKFLAGTLPDVSNFAAMLRDPRHLDWTTGQYAASLTVYSTMFGVDVSQVIPPDGYYDLWGDDDLTPALAAAINGTVWQVVSSNAWTRAVPEPSSWILLLGTAALLRWRRR